MQDLFEEIKTKVSFEDVLERFCSLRVDRNNKVCCPLHHEKTASFTVYPETNSFHCFGCNKGGDQVKFVSLLKNVDNLTAAKMIADEFNIRIDENRHQTNKEQSNQNKVDPKVNEVSKNNLKTIQNYVDRCQKNVSKTDFFYKRGLNNESISHFRLGYDVETNSVVFPYNKEGTYYQTRKVNEKEFKKPPTNIAGNEPIYNENILLSKDLEPIFVVESPICAISIWQCGGKSIALGGAGGINKLIEFAKKHKPTSPLILCLDNDNTGRNAQNKLDDELEKLNIICVPFNVADECKDPNELLLKDKYRLKKNVGIGISRGNKFTIKGKEFTLAELKDEELPNIFYCVEDLLPQGLTVMAAPPKAGKSFFSLQMSIAISMGKPFLNHKTNKCDVLYLALEDNKQRIQARARKMLINEKEWPNNLHINLTSNNMDTGLLKDLKAKVRKDPNIRLIIIDTMQKIRGKAGKNETAYTTDYNELGKIKEFADKYDLAILLIHHFRKQKDADDVFNQFSGSNGINGVSDNMLAFQTNKDLPTELKCKGRDLYFDPIAIELNKDTGLWESIGSIEEQKERKARQEYENNDLVKVCKHLAPLNWRGTATDFIEQAGRYLGYSPYVVNERNLGKELEKLSFQLRQYDKIVYLRPTKTGRTHAIYYEQTAKTQLNI